MRYQAEKVTSSLNVTCKTSNDASKSRVGSCTGQMWPEHCVYHHEKITITITSVTSASDNQMAKNAAVPVGKAL